MKHRAASRGVFIIPRKRDKKEKRSTRGAAMTAYLKKTCKFVEKENVLSWNSYFDWKIYEIFVDGSKIGETACECTKTFPIADGPHRISIRHWTGRSSSSVDVEALNGRTVSLIGGTDKHFKWFLKRDAPENAPIPPTTKNYPGRRTARGAPPGISC
jgi:hypothetical protein